MMQKFSEPEARQYSPLTLAFLGDSVYEIQVRFALTAAANCPVRALHTEKIRYVCAAFQAKAADALQAEFTGAELAVYHRGRNAGGTPSKNADPADYRKATGLEAVFGYLYLMGDTARIHTLFQLVWENRTVLLNASSSPSHSSKE